MCFIGIVYIHAPECAEKSCFAAASFTPEVQLRLGAGPFCPDMGGPKTHKPCCQQNAIRAAKLATKVLVIPGMHVDCDVQVNLLASELSIAEIK